MIHPAPRSKAGTQADYDQHDVDDGALSPMPRGRLDDANWRQERARKARAAQNHPGHHLRQVIRAGEGQEDARWAVRLAAEQFPLTAEQVAAARKLAAALQWAADLSEDPA